MSPNAVVHVFFAVAALILGVVVFRLPKGTTLHRGVGGMFVLSMFGVNITALTIFNLFDGFGTFHVLAIINLGLLLVALFAVLIRWPHQSWLRVHCNAFCYTYIGLVAAVLSEAITRIPNLPFEGAVIVPTVAVSVIGGIVVWRRESQTIAAAKISPR